ncbi:MAG: helix-turn-helix domain-containing protein [Planctomycetota bacterium]|nr:helix-turn-helix domain-containing protein [Planctomycetota bacterium]
MSEANNKPIEEQTTPTQQEDEKYHTDPGGDMGLSETFGDTGKEMGLSDVQLRAVELSIQGHTDVHIAELLSINRRTIWRWKKLDTNYRQALADARMHAHASVADGYQTLVQRATSVLSQLLDSPIDNNRYRAAQTILSMVNSFKPQPADKVPEYDLFVEPWLPPKVG